jgi:hypothetical protein
LWDDAKIREFSLGIQVQLKPTTFEVTLADRTIKAASEVKARINVTIYSPATEIIDASKPAVRSLLLSTKERSC